MGKGMLPPNYLWIELKNKMVKSIEREKGREAERGMRSAGNGAINYHKNGYISS